jgi:hypothetical protein
MQSLRVFLFDFVGALNNYDSRGNLFFGASN